MIMFLSQAETVLALSRVSPPQCRNIHNFEIVRSSAFHLTKLMADFPYIISAAPYNLTRS